MIQSKLIRPTKFPLPLKQLDCESPFSNLKSSDLLRQSSDDLLAFSAFKPQATDLFQPIRRPLTRNQTSSPTDSGVSVGSYDSSELTPSSSFVPSSSHMPSSSFMPSSSHMPSNMPSSITPIDDGWSSNRFGSSGFDLAGQLKTANDPFGAIDQRSSTAFGQFDLFSSTDRLADIWKPSTEPRSSNFDPFTSQSATKSAETRPAGRPLLNSLGKLSDRDVAYESDYGWKAATSASRDHLDATFVDAKRFGASVEQCDTDCNACYKRCDDCTQFSALLDLAEKSYQANYKDITYNAESLIDPTTNLPIFMDTKFCRFCKNNKEKREIYLGHTTRNRAGETTCPVLMKHICEECGATGAQAHTRSYCPMLKATKSEDLKLAVKLYHGNRRN